MCYLIGRLAYFAFYGLLAIVLVGPVVGIAGALLPFAIIGLAVYGGYHGVRRLFAKRKTELPLDKLHSEEAPPVLVALPAEEEVAPKAPSRRGRVLVEMLCGGVVGGLVAGVMCWQTPELAGTIAPAVVAGLVVGYVVGGAAARPSAAYHADAHS